MTHYYVQPSPIRRGHSQLGRGIAAQPETTHLLLPSIMPFEDQDDYSGEQRSVRAVFVSSKITIVDCRGTCAAPPAKPKQPKSSEGKSKKRPTMNNNAHKYTKHNSTTVKKAGSATAKKTGTTTTKK